MHYSYIPAVLVSLTLPFLLALQPKASKKVHTEITIRQDGRYTPIRAVGQQVALSYGLQDNPYDSANTEEFLKGISDVLGGNKLSQGDNTKENLATYWDKRLKVAQANQATRKLQLISALGRSGYTLQQGFYWKAKGTRTSKKPQILIDGTSVAPIVEARMLDLVKSLPNDKGLVVFIEANHIGLSGNDYIKVTVH